jgi:TonB family protein
MHPRPLITAILILALLGCRQPPTDDRRPAQPKPAPTAAARQTPRPAPAPTRKAETVYRVGRGVSRPELIHQVEPDYGRLARSRGVLILEAVITKQGTVEHARMLKPAEPEVEAELLGAVRQWRFRPAMKDGKPVPVYYTLTLNIDWQ